MMAPLTHDEATLLRAMMEANTSDRLCGDGDGEHACILRGGSAQRCGMEVGIAGCALSLSD